MTFHSLCVHVLCYVVVLLFFLPCVKCLSPDIPLTLCSRFVLCCCLTILCTLCEVSLPLTYRSLCVHVLCYVVHLLSFLPYVKCLSLDISLTLCSRFVLCCFLTILCTLCEVSLPLTSRSLCVHVLCYVVHLLSFLPYVKCLSLDIPLTLCSRFVLCCCLTILCTLCEVSLPLTSRSLCVHVLCYVVHLLSFFTLCEVSLP